MNYPFAQATKEGFTYSKEQNFFLQYSVNVGGRQYIEEPSYIAKFPSANWHTPYAFIKPNPNCDVYYSTMAIDKATHNLLVYSLDKLAKNTEDYFVPKYQNIIDPNLTAVEQPLQKRENGKIMNSTAIQWVATNFLIEEAKVTKPSKITALRFSIAKLGKSFKKNVLYHISQFLQEITIGKASIASPIPNLNPKENKEIYVAIETIFSAALPLLAKLRKPSLILPGKLQACIKAQRIYLNPGEDYSGIWHRDGKNEDIAAVVIYYYRTSEGLEGGDLEFVDKKPINS